MKKIPQIKKDLKVFLTSEEARITKKNALEIGLSIMTAFFVLQAMNSASAGTSTNSWLRQPNKRGEHFSHTSHGSHGSHGQW